MIAVSGKSKRVFIACNGCGRRHLDAAKLVDFFKANNYMIVRSADAADYIIFVTCSFKKYSEEKCFKEINKFLKYKGELIVVGCLPDIAPNRLKEVFHGKVVETRNLEKIDELFAGFKVKFSSMPDANLQYNDVKAVDAIFWRTLVFNFRLNKVFIKKCLKRLTEIFKGILPLKLTKTAFLRVSRGCVEHCAYCNIFRAIGKLKSKRIDECQREYSVLLKMGYRKFRLLADNLGAYGLDCGNTFAELLQRFSDVDSGYSVNWFLSELHPRWAIAYSDVLSRYIVEGKITDISCPVQSGSNRILQLMNRHHSIEEITETLKRFRMLKPGLKFQTHLIVGFPSETEEDIAATINAAQAINFSEVLLNAYYDGYGSISSKMSDKIPQDKILARLNRVNMSLQKAGIVCFCDKDIWLGMQQRRLADG